VAAVCAALAVNRDLIRLYLVRQQTEGCGTKVIERFAKQSTRGWRSPSSVSDEPRQRSTATPLKSTV
jgi:hypothetical protein